MHLIYSALSVLLLSPLVAATSSGTRSNELDTRSAGIFSFAAWVRGIDANPDGKHLTPTEAIAAWEASINATGSDVDKLQRRWGCNTRPGSEAWRPDAVVCVNDLANKGRTPCIVNGEVRFLQYANAAITGVARGGVSSSACIDVAIAAAVVLDKCSRSDNTVQGFEYANGNGDIVVWISSPFA